MKVHFFHQADSGLAHYRMWQPAENIKDLDVVRMADDDIWWKKPIDWLDEARHEADVLYYQYKPNMSAQAKMIMSKYLIKGEVVENYKPLIVDIDDDFFNVEATNPIYPDLMRTKVLGQKVEYIPPEDVLAAKMAEKRNAENFDKFMKEGNDQGVEVQFRIVEKDGKYYAVYPASDFVKNFIDEARHCDCLTVSTEPLKKLYAPYAKRIEVVPNGIDFEKFPSPLPNDNPDTVRIGLIGGASHYSDWKIFGDVLPEIIKQFPQVVFVNNAFVHTDKETKEKTVKLADYFQWLKGHPQYEMYTPVCIQEYYGWLNGMKLDIGVAPLTDSKFNEGKSNLKYLEYGALGIPGVFSDVPAYQSVKHGETGYLASNAKDWIKYLSRLIKDSTLRKRMGAEARKHIQKDYNMKEIGKRYSGVIQSVYKDFQANKAGKPTNIFEGAVQ